MFNTAASPACVLRHYSLTIRIIQDLATAPNIPVLAAIILVRVAQLDAAIRPLCWRMI